MLDNGRNHQPGQHEAAEVARESAPPALAPVERYILEQRLIGRQSVAEVAAACGLPEAEVLVRQHRILRFLRARSE